MLAQQAPDSPLPHDWRPMAPSADTTSAGSSDPLRGPPMITTPTSPIDWKRGVADRYRGGEDRAVIFRDLIRQSLPPDGSGCALDIGCGQGLDRSVDLQRSIADRCTLIGVEPDPAVSPDPCLAEVHRCRFERADLPPDAFDAAYSVMVLEHIDSADAFWAQVRHCLKPGGVFWGLTVDARSVFALASQTMEKLRVKDAYLSRVGGRRGSDRYENYPTYYRANSPRAIARHTPGFASRQFVSLHRRRQMHYYVPPRFRFAMTALDAAILTLGLPGSVLLVRLQK